MRKGRIKYYFKNKNAVINDVGKLCDMNEQLEQELERYKNIIDKAVEYIENVKTLNEEDRYITMKWEYGVLFPKLLNILQGSDK